MKRPIPTDIRKVFDQLGDDALLDDLQVASVLCVSRVTLRRWRALGQAPRSILLNASRRTRVGDLRRYIEAARNPAIAAE